MVVELPCGATIKITTQEVIGQNLAISGGFESAELDVCRQLAAPGSTTFDVGANVGLFTLTMSTAVGMSGRVIALEPVKYNLDRLSDHIRDNRADNVELVAAAAGESPGFAEIDSDFDPAYAAVSSWQSPEAATPSAVRVLTLDDLWIAADCPDVSLVKIDVEGHEVDVIKGALRMLERSRPHLLIEAPTAALLNRVSEVLTRFGYRASQPEGFESWNYLFSSESQAA
jgi:FkbM family methyltransferase